MWLSSESLVKRSKPAYRSLVQNGSWRASHAGFQGDCHVASKLVEVAERQTTGTSYWLVLSALGANDSAEWNFNSSGDTSGGVNFQFSQFGSLTGPGTIQDGSTRAAFQNDGLQTSAVPEPT